jgi:hypothetical protein
VSGLPVDLRAVVEDASSNHPLLAKLTEWLADIVLGQEAAVLLARLDDAAEHGCELSVGQVWIWREALIDVGRKARAGPGLVYRLPIRVTWSGPHLRLGPRGSPRTWSALGMGWVLGGRSVPTSGAGALRLAPLLRSHRDPDNAAGLEAWPAVTPMVRTVPGSPRAALAELAEAGRLARWELLMWLQPTVASSLSKAHTALRVEMGTSSRLAPPLVDQVKLDQLADQMLFGDGAASSSADRLVALCTAVGTFVRVDPLRYMTTAIRRDASTALRRAVGDPHIGRKVRAVARELGTNDVETVVGEYRRRWPADHLAVDRAAQAMSVGSDPMASWVSVERC